MDLLNIIPYSKVIIFLTSINHFMIVMEVKSWSPCDELIHAMKTYDKVEVQLHHS
jgi:hypothetical protein